MTQGSAVRWRNSLTAAFWFAAPSTWAKRFIVPPIGCLTYYDWHGGSTRDALGFAAVARDTSPDIDPQHLLSSRGVRCNREIPFIRMFAFLKRDRFVLLSVVKQFPATISKGSPEPYFVRNTLGRFDQVRYLERLAATYGLGLDRSELENNLISDKYRNGCFKPEAFREAVHCDARVIAA